MNRLLFQSAWRAIRDSFHALSDAGVPGAVMALQTAGDRANYHPHIHCLASDGVVLDGGSFQQLSLDPGDLQHRFAEHLFAALLKEQLITDEVVEDMRNWPHSGFSVWAGPTIEPQDTEARLFVSEYIHKGSLKLKRMSIVEPQGGPARVRYHAADNTHQDHDPVDFLAQISLHIPRKWEQTVRYFGAHSARTRGKRRASVEPAPAIELGEAPQKTKPSSTWARLIKKVYLVDPLKCKRCGQAMRIVAFITDFDECRRIAANLAIPQYRAPPPICTPLVGTRYEPLAEYEQN